jgi:hypothetical protein
MTAKRKLEIPAELEGLSAAAHEAVCGLHKCETRADFDAALDSTWKAYCAFHGPVMMPAGRSAETQYYARQLHVKGLLVQAACALAHHLSGAKQP